MDVKESSNADRLINLVDSYHTPPKWYSSIPFPRVSCSAQPPLQSNITPKPGSRRHGCESTAVSRRTRYPETTSSQVPACSHFGAFERVLLTSLQATGGGNPEAKSFMKAPMAIIISPSIRCNDKPGISVSTPLSSDRQFQWSVPYNLAAPLRASQVSSPSWQILPFQSNGRTKTGET